ncbi:hypothetical protein AADZ91_00765 [Colwelliaceae bacterium 6441]
MTFQYRAPSFHFTSLFLLAVMLFSAVGHTHELSTEASQSIEQLDCKLCQQPSEPPKQKIELVKVTLGYFSAFVEPFVNSLPRVAQYRTTSPRAPPYII